MRKPLYPLRLIVEYVEDKIVLTDGMIIRLPKEILECGHKVTPKEDLFGPTNASRRRCRECHRNRSAT